MKQYSPNSISLQHCRTIRYLQRDPALWVTCSEIAQNAAISSRSSQTHAKWLVENGIAEVAAVYPPKYRLISPDALAPSALALWRDLLAACVMFRL